MQNYKKIGTLKIANQINLLFKRRSSKKHGNFQHTRQTFHKHLIFIHVMIFLQIKS